MEKIRFGNTEYELVPNGVFESKDNIKVTVQKGNNSVDSIAEAANGNDVIQILDNDGEVMVVLRGYSDLKSAVLQKNYMIPVGTSTVAIDVVSLAIYQADLTSRVDTLEQEMTEVQEIIVEG